MLIYTEEHVYKSPTSLIGELVLNQVVILYLMRRSFGIIAHFLIQCSIITKIARAKFWRKKGRAPWRRTFSKGYMADLHHFRSSVTRSSILTKILANT